MISRESIEKLQASLGLSDHAAEVYFAALESGGGTLTELARTAGLVRTVMHKPLNALIKESLITRRRDGKRLKYYAANPEELPKIFERRKFDIESLSKALSQQISAPDQNVQVRWFIGITGIKEAIHEFFRKSKGEYRQFENADTYQYLGVKFGEEIVSRRVKTKKENKLIVIGNRESTGWYKDRIIKAKEELRDVVVISSESYPFRANMAVSANLTLIFEYQKNPFALIIDSQFVTESISTLHQIIWDRYRREE